MISTPALAHCYPQVTEHCSPCLWSLAQPIYPVILLPIHLNLIVLLPF